MTVPGVNEPLPGQATVKDVAAAHPNALLGVKIDGVYHALRLDHIASAVVIFTLYSDDTEGAQ